MKRHQGKLTIKDIARSMGITPATVSKALRDSSDISPQTRKNVKRVANEMGYRPNILARSLVKQKSHMLGVLIPELRTSFFAKVAQGIYEAARKHHYKPILMVNDENPKIEEDNLEFFLSLPIDGLLLNPTPDSPNTHFIEMLKKQNVPIVSYDRKLESIELPLVTTDNIKAAYEMTQHLLDNGRQRLLYLGPKESISVARDRYQGYRQALNDNNIPYSEQMEAHTTVTRRNAYEVMAKVLQTGYQPDGVICIGGLVAYGAGKAIFDAGLSIPSDIQLAEFGDNDIVARLGVPFITMDQSPHDIGSQAVLILLDYITNPQLEKMQHVVIPAKIKEIKQ